MQRSRYGPSSASMQAATDLWGDLSEVHDVAVGETMRRLVEEEHGAGQEPW
jgi:hypothetical protein